MQRGTFLSEVRRKTTCNSLMLLAPHFISEISLQEAQAENAAQENKGLRMQLIFIYLAVALVLFLIAFYI